MKLRMLQLLLITFSITIIALVILVDFQGLNQRGFRAPFIITGIGLFLVGMTFRTRWRKANILFAIAMIGQAYALQMLNAPPWSVYQKYYHLRELLTFPRGIFFLGIVAQTIVILLAGRPVWRQIRGLLLRILSKTQVVGIIAFLLLIMAAFSTNYRRYSYDVMMAMWISIVGILNLILIVMAVPEESLQKISNWIKNRLLTDATDRVSTTQLEKIWPWAIAFSVFVISATLAWVVFERVPHIPDGVGYLFQAKYLSTGQLYLPAPPDAASFEYDKLHNDGTKWWNYGFPGWPSVLALGVLAGVPWLVNPVLAGLTVLLAFSLICKLYNRRTATVAIALLAVSPWFLFMSASFMAHPVSIVFALVLLLALVKEREDRRGLWGCLAGASLGALVLTRPLEAILLGAVAGMWALGLGSKSLSWRGLSGFVVFSFVVGSLVLPYNHALTGNAFLTPHKMWADARWYPGADQLGFGPNVGNLGWNHLDPFPGHSMIDVIVNAQENIFMSNTDLFGWSFGSLVFVMLILFWRQLKGSDWLMLSIIIVVVFGHSFYWFNGGPDIGARYWYQILIPLIILTVRGIQELQSKWLETGGNITGALRIGAFVAVACLMVIITFIPWRSISKYSRYRGISGDVQRLSKKYNFGESLVFVRAIDKEDFSAAFIYNPPTLDSPGTIYARDTGERDKVLKRYPNRPVWTIGRLNAEHEVMQVLSGPTVSGLQKRP